MMPFFLLLAAIIIIGIILLSIIAKRKPKLSAGTKDRINKQWQHACQLPDDTRKILEADKVLDSLLKELGYQGSLGDKLKKAGNVIPNINEVWTAHKLRNRLAHEPGAHVSPQEAQQAMRAFGRVIGKYVS